jgi:hypothetical protein
MKRLISFSVLFIFGIVSVVCVSLTASARAETFVGSNADNRVTVALRVGQAASQAWLPAPWQVEPVPAGPFKGANLLVVFIDRLLNQDPEGKPAAGGTFRLAALYVPAKHPQTGESAPFIIRVFGPHEGSGPYKNSVQTTVRREATLRGANSEPGVGSDLWEVRDGAGGILEFRMDYQRAVPVRTKGEARPHSNVDPTFFRMYRYDQVMDVVKSIPEGIDRVQSYQLRTTMSELRDLFDGSEQLVGIAIIPWYARQTFLP